MLAESLLWVYLSAKAGGGVTASLLPLVGLPTPCASCTLRYIHKKIQYYYIYICIHILGLSNSYYFAVIKLSNLDSVALHYEAIVLFHIANRKPYFEMTNSRHRFVIAARLHFMQSNRKP